LDGSGIRCGDGGFSLRKSQDSLPIIFQVPRSEEENLRHRRARSDPSLSRGVLWAGFFHAAWSRTSRHPHNREFAAFEESFDKSTEGPRLVLLLSPT